MRCALWVEISKEAALMKFFSSDDGKTTLKVIAELDVKSSRFSKSNPYKDSLNKLYDKMISEIEKS